MGILGKVSNFYNSLGTLELLIVAFICLKVIHNVYKILQKQSDVARKIPSPPGWPIINHLPSILFYATNYISLLDYWFNSYSKNGRLRYSAPTIDKERVAVSSLKDIKTILVSKCRHFSRPSLKRVFPALQDSILAVEGKEHTWQRKLMCPTFTLTSVKSFIPKFHKHTERLVEVWKQVIHGCRDLPCQITIEKGLGKLTFDILGDTIFGHEFNSIANEKDEFGDALETAINIGTNRSVLLYGILPKWVRWIFIPENVQKREKANELVKEHVKKLIQCKREEIMAKEKDLVHHDTDADMLEKMMRAQDQDSGKKLSDEALQGNITALTVAGYETTCTSMTWTLYLLACYPEKQEKARKEVLSVLGDKLTITYEDLEKVPYITYLIKESLRLYSPAPFVNRKIIAPCKLGDVEVTPDNSILITFFRLTHSEKLWSDPNCFRPERFDEEDGTGVDIQSKHFPFSLGPYGCIGSKYAMLEMRVVIAMMLKNFRFSLTPNHPEIKPQTRFTMKPHPPPCLEIEIL